MSGREPDDLGATLALDLQRPIVARARPDEDWHQVLTWKPVHVAAEAKAVQGAERIGRLVAEPSNSADPLAIVVVCSAGPIGYVDSFQAAHLSRALRLLDVSPVVRLRLTRRRNSPRFDVLLPEVEPDGRPCRVCGMLDEQSRELRFGPL